MSVFSSLQALPSDPLLGLMAAFRQDPRPDKIDLGVGVYRDDAGETPVMRAVIEAEKRLAAVQHTKSYESQRGNLDFCAEIETFVFGSDRMGRAQDIVSYATPGGTGALFLGLALMARANPQATVWISKPDWPNHPHIAKMAGLRTANYRYVDAAAGQVDIQGLVHDLKVAKAGDVLILQGKCHNPTGIDPSPEALRTIAATCAQQGITLFLDMAYHGFGDGLEADMAPLRTLFQHLPNTLVAYSCSKNFGLYRERAGCLLFLAESADLAGRVSGNIGHIARGIWSMPPANGPALVSLILSAADLRALWLDELAEMRSRIQTIRKRLAAAMFARTGLDRFAMIAHQSGMFAQLPIRPGADAEIRDTLGIYLPGSGRINLAGLNESDIEAVANRLTPFLSVLTKSPAG